MEVFEFFGGCASMTAGGNLSLGPAREQILQPFSHAARKFLKGYAHSRGGSRQASFREGRAVSRPAVNDSAGQGKLFPAVRSFQAKLEAFPLLWGMKAMKKCAPQAQVLGNAPERASPPFVNQREADGPASVYSSFRSYIIQTDFLPLSSGKKWDRLGRKPRLFFSHFIYLRVL
jgi:hypothetical protein